MSPIVHLELGWLIGAALPDRRDRRLVALAGILPDADGLTILFGADFYAQHHHRFTHGWLAALVMGALVLAFSRRRVAATLAAVAAFHLHLLCDLAGSGPAWPLGYLWPLSDAMWSWEGQWDLASWQNGLIGLAASALCLATALGWRRTVVEVFSRRGDAAVVAAVRRRFLGGQAAGE